jgi:hypothetical protein
MKLRAPESGLAARGLACLSKISLLNGPLNPALVSRSHWSLSYFPLSEQDARGDEANSSGNNQEPKRSRRSHAPMHTGALERIERPQRAEA